jgi:pimeloyl-ACP methyl ester carboxylesterase
VLRMVALDAALVYVGFCAVLFFIQRSLIYFPQPAYSDAGATPLILQMPTARVMVSTRPKDGPLALIYFGGNAEDVSFNLPSFSAAFPSHAIYLLHYRGYGGSTGEPSEKALFADAIALFDQVRTTHSDITVVGRSLGSGIAVYVASVRPVARLVLVTPFDSLQEIAATQFWYAPVRWLLLDKYQSWKFAPQVTAPTSIIAAERDEIVPRASSELLRSRFKTGLASFEVIPGVGHNDISESPQYMPLLQRSPKPL